MKKTLSVLLTLVLLAACFAVPALAAGYGDVDGDSKLTAADARLALRAAVGLTYYRRDSEQFSIADVDRDGTLSAADARILLRAAVGLPNVGAEIAYNADRWQTGLGSGLRRAYAAEVNRLIGLGGKGSVKDNTLRGLSFVRLVDMDNNGTPELLCAYSDSASMYFSNKMALYTYENGRLRTLYDGEICNQGSDFSPMMWLVQNGDTKYLATGMVFYRSFLQLANGKLTETLFYVDTPDYYFVNERLVPESYYRERYGYFTNGVIESRTYIYQYDLSGAVQVLNETDAVIALLNR